MDIRRPGKRLGLGLLVLATSALATVGYTATHASGHERFDSCRVLSDGTVVLDYTYGAGDKVTTSVEPQASTVIVSLRRDRAPGLQPAVALAGQLRFDPFGGLGRRTLTHDDGTEIACS